jgi:hypothetical protein
MVGIGIGTTASLTPRIAVCRPILPPPTEFK